MISVEAKLWMQKDNLEAVPYMCGHCNRFVSSTHGINNIGAPARVRICPNCGRSTYIEPELQVPGPAFGDDIDYLNEHVHSLYNEARRSLSVNSFTASVLCCRKLLMNTSVSKGASEGESFVYYIDFLLRNNYITPDIKDCIDHIRELGNQAAHEIKLMTRQDAELLIRFTEHLLRHIFELPGRIKNLQPVATQP